MNDIKKSRLDAGATAVNQSARAWDAAAIFQKTAITYDAGDKANGSLYLCDPTGGQQKQIVEKVIRNLRGNWLWSAEEPKHVRDDQRKAYEEQLSFIEAMEFVMDGSTLVIARCEHPKFPSSAERFSAWKIVLGGVSKGL